MRSILSAVAAVVLAGACSKSNAPDLEQAPPPHEPSIESSAGKPGSKSSAMSNATPNAIVDMERVKKWAGPDTTVAPVDDVAVDGLAFFWLTPATPGAHDLDRGYGVAVAPGADRWLAGKDAMRAVLGRGVTDAALLARASMLLLEDGGQPLTGVDDASLPAAARAQAEKAGVVAPRVEDGVLVYWSYLRRTSRPGLMRSRLDLDTLAVDRKSPGQIEVETGDPIEIARQWLVSADAHTRRNGVERLVAHCADVRAARVLAETLRAHAQADTRARAAEMMARCHDDGSAAALIQALGGDASAEVRQWAASSLGAIGGPDARAALDRARTGDQDENVRLMAQMALAKLK